jgi:CRP/FNR family transcriptional regulator, cyclic AMP receptor protein
VPVGTNCTILNREQGPWYAGLVYCAARSVPAKVPRSPKKANLKTPVFDAQAFLDLAGVARKVKEFKRAEAFYSQGDAANSVMYLQEGGVKLTVISEVGKEAVVAILRPGDFFGEGCLASQSVRMGTATAITPRHRVSH